MPHTPEAPVAPKHTPAHPDLTYRSIFRHQPDSSRMCDRREADVFDLHLTVFDATVTFTPNIDRGGMTDPVLGTEIFDHAERVAHLLADAPEMLDLLREIVDRVESTPGAALPLDLDTHVRGLLARHSRFGG